MMDRGKFMLKKILWTLCTLFSVSLYCQNIIVTTPESFKRTSIDQYQYCELSSQKNIFHVVCDGQAIAIISDSRLSNLLESMKVRSALVAHIINSEFHLSQTITEEEGNQSTLLMMFLKQ